MHTIRGSPHGHGGLGMGLSSLAGVAGIALALAVPSCLRAQPADAPGPRRAMLVLTSGDSLELVADSSDLGGGFRGLVVKSSGGDDAELDWNEFVRVDFASAPPDHATPRSSRLHGTVRTAVGRELAGLIAWDLDEALTTDVLDGEQGRVDWSNRGIEVTDAAFGRVVVGWDDFVSIRFDAPSAPTGGRDAFEIGGRLRGSVTAADARRASGLVRWDIADERGWDVLEATSGSTRFTVEIERVLSIAKGVSTARVTLVDGTVREASIDGEDSGDFREANRGVFVETPSAATVMVPWRDLLTVTFER